MPFLTSFIILYYSASLLCDLNGLFLSADCSLHLAAFLTPVSTMACGQSVPEFLLQQISFKFFLPIFICLFVSSLLCLIETYFSKY